GNMAKTDLNRELSEADYDQLASILSRVVGGKIPNVEALDGFLTALIVGRELVPPSEYVATIISGEDEDGDLVFESMNEVEDFYGMISRYWNQIARTYSRGEIHMPYLL